MGLAVRIIPTLLTRGRTLVKGVAFDSWRSVGMAHQAVRIHSMRGVDELVMLDIAATPEKRGPDLKLVEELAETCFMPLAVGGGIACLQDIKALLRAGADKVVIRTAGPLLCRAAADTVGSQAIVAAIDATSLDRNPETCAQLNDQAVRKAVKWQEAGAGEIMLTRCEREGLMRGYDIALIRAVTEAVDIPVIAHGGCGTYHDMVLAVMAGANAVAAGSMFQFTDQTPRGAAEFLKKNNIEVRL